MSVIDPKFRIAAPPMELAIVGQHTLVENMARPMPVWLVFPYTAYFGVLPMVMYRAFRKGVSARAMWLMPPRLGLFPGRRLLSSIRTFRIR